MRHPHTVMVTLAQNDVRPTYRDGVPGVLAWLDPGGCDVRVSADGRG